MSLDKMRVRGRGRGSVGGGAGGEGRLTLSKNTTQTNERRKEDGRLCSLLRASSLLPFPDTRMPSSGSKWL